jgi:hypothetical protein
MAADLAAGSTESKALEQALALIDRNLAVFQARELVSADEVADLLLDLRLLLVSAELEPTASSSLV